MSENKIGFALVHEICPICGKPMNEQILMNSVLSKKYAKELENVHGKAIGYSKTACEDCSKYKDEAVIYNLSSNFSTSFALFLSISSPFCLINLIAIFSSFL